MEHVLLFNAQNCNIALETQSSNAFKYNAIYVPVKSCINRKSKTPQHSISGVRILPREAASPLRIRDLSPNQVPGSVLQRALKTLENQIIGEHLSSQFSRLWTQTLSNEIRVLLPFRGFHITATGAEDSKFTILAFRNTVSEGGRMSLSCSGKAFLIMAGKWLRLFRHFISHKASNSFMQELHARVLLSTNKAQSVPGPLQASIAHDSTSEYEYDLFSTIS